MLKKMLNWILGVEETDRTDMLEEIGRAEKAEVDTALQEVVTLKELPLTKPVRKSREAGKSAVKKKVKRKPATKKKVVKKKVTKKKTTKKLVKKKVVKKKPLKKKVVKKKTKKPVKKKTTKKTKVGAKITKKESVVKFLKTSKAPKSMDAIAKKVGITTQTARRYLFYLKKEGKVNTKNNGWVSK
ncbi:MAG: HTH domain-containing protein [Candidatus Altiarchaeota archaeon]|nr:HTH domain-containing protein [Candidatus Altiarchaeota archaeon]